MTTEDEKDTETVEYIGPYAHWWHRLVKPELCRARKWQPLPTAHKAILKRCKNLEEVMLSEPFQALWQMVPDEKRSPPKMEVTALAAWVLSSVKDDADMGLAQSMAQKASDGSDRPKVSTLRFQQLIKSRDTTEFARRLRRILPQIDNTVSVTGLAREIENWYWQNRSSAPETDPTKRQVLQWAMGYYAITPKTQ
ncbi:type I-E CRISPR-associated protein Cse2/CasB [Kineobactrum salinum]|uniref:Type I-E CRISPR-associated protein Cse2/CasB n=1 Tax=Kineobactrum salinum TaxID=2708301 RepID=A0A6C0TXS2_9GAMM|nr:type I-E CRISPR-associated protein Cse2/CasB [Kineobactrum salinum]QIB64630.1 type I-E CRISPR-associated protein Cse2/CasB [Kineobactrum salinum]